MGPVIAACVLALGFALFALYWATSHSDTMAVEREARTTERVIDDRIATVAKDQEAVAVWDDAVLQLRRPVLDQRWLDANIGGWLHNSAEHDLTFILNARDEPVYAMVFNRNLPPAAFRKYEPELRGVIARVRGRVREGSHRFDRHPGVAPGRDVLTTSKAIHDTELVSFAGRPAVVSAMLVLPLTRAIVSRRGSEPILISVRFLGPRFLAELETRNLIGAPRFSWRPDRQRGEAAVPLHNGRGQALGYFIWKPDLPGRRIKLLLAPIAWLVAVAIFCLMSVLVLWLRRCTNELKATVLRLQVSEAQAQHLAFHDPLTGLANRAYFSERLEQALKGAGRGGSLALLLLDLDRFKVVNDTLGHLAGDALIREFGQRIARLVRAGDMLARLGGDEFALLVVGTSDLTDVTSICDRVLAAVREPFEVVGTAAFVGVSVGVVTAPEAGLNRVELVRKADIALYQAKEAGGNCYRFFHAEMDERIKFRSAIEEDLRAALTSGEGLSIHYQPEVAADKDRTVLGLEALVRWQHPNRGFIPPEQFVPVAEDTGLICQLGQWVLEGACQAAKRWPTLFVAINLSPVQLRAQHFPEKVIRIIRAAGIDPARIELEVTEGTLLEDDEAMRAGLATLRAAGIRIALDDFGTGYSSLSYLRSFDVDKIKIDRSFVQHLGDEIDSASIVAAVVSIGHAMGLTVVAEGVETEEQRAFLAAAGCDQMQGYLFSRPLPEEDIAVLLAESIPQRDAA